MRNSVGAIIAACSVFMLEHEAHACGGVVVPPGETESIVTDHEMILSVSMSQTTLYDQIKYRGSPESFAWILPIKGTVTVGLSADVLFQVVDALTTTEVQAPPTGCPPAPTCGQDVDGGLVGPIGVAHDGTGVTVTSQKQVGPYETVKLHSSDGGALTQWLTQHGYQIPEAAKPIVGAYVTQGFDFLALKLVPGKGVSSMQPVRVTSKGASPALPLQMVAMGTGSTTGITLWVVADGRWEPSNFPTFTIPDSQIAWDWATSTSNYEKVRVAAEAKYGGRGWQIESSLELSQYDIQQMLEQSVDGDPVGGYLPTPPGSAGDAGAEAGAEIDGGDGAVGATDDGGAQAQAAIEDLAVLLAGVAQPNVRITRMRSDIAQSALSKDMTLQAAKDQSELANVHIAGQQVGEPQCAVFNQETCAQTGTAPRSQAIADERAAGEGCSTAPQKKEPETMLVLLATAGVVAFRLRQRRRG